MILSMSHIGRMLSHVTSLFAWPASVAMCCVRHEHAGPLTFGSTRKQAQANSFSAQVKIHMRALDHVIRRLLRSNDIDTCTVPAVRGFAQNPPGLAPFSPRFESKPRLFRTLNPFRVQRRGFRRPPE